MDDINKGLTNLFNTLTIESDEESMKMFEKAFSCIKKSKINIENPEYFDCFINYKLEQGTKLLANTLHEPSVCKDKDKPNFIYTNYNFLENHIKNLCVLKEGLTCYADKSRYIIKMYLEYSITGKIPDFDSSIEKYYIPNFGNNKMWINYCNSLCKLYYGYTEEYFKAYNDLIQCDIRKFKHTLHIWYIELNDGQIIEFERTWDNDIKNPLDDTDKGDFYIMHKTKIKNKNFEIYEPIDDKEKLLYRKFYVKIPKSKIKQVYKKSEELMI